MRAILLALALAPAPGSRGVVRVPRDEEFHELATKFPEAALAFALPP